MFLQFFSLVKYQDSSRQNCEFMSKI